MRTKRGLSDLSIIVIVSAVVILLSLSVFFGKIGSETKVGNAQKVFEAQLLADATTTDIKCPEGWSLTDGKVCCPPGTTAKHLLGDSYVCVKDCVEPQKPCVQTCCEEKQVCKKQPGGLWPAAFGYCFDDKKKQCKKGETPCGPDGETLTCCTADQVCTPKSKGPVTVWGCSAKKDDCEKKKGEFCPGDKDYKDANLCCTGGSKCFVSPNGMPACVPPTTTTTDTTTDTNTNTY